MNILFTLCGRAGSKGVKNKNISSFCGYPLPYYSLAAIRLFCDELQESGVSAKLALSTDSKELANMILSVAPETVYIDRAQSLAGDAVRKIDVIRDAAKQSEQRTGLCFDHVIDLDITSPLRKKDDLHRVFQKRLVSDADVVYTVVESRRSPYFNMVSKKENGYYSTVIASQYSARQQVPEVFEMNASIYAYSRVFIYSVEPLFNKADIVLMDDTGVLDIDRPEDLQFMQAIANCLFETKEEYAIIQKTVKGIAGK